MKNKLPTIKFCVILFFLIAETIIYVLFMARDIAGTQGTTAIKYAGILLCLAMAAAQTAFAGHDGLLIAAALLFTAVSDIFILVLNDYYEIGLCTFIAVQTAYYARIYLTNGKNPLPSLAVRAGLAAAVMVALAATASLEPLTALVAVYFTGLLVNAVESAFLIKLSKRYILFALGLLLFIGCDICVGIYNFGPVLGISLPPALLNFAAVAMWGFYLPSQVLIVLSANKIKYKPYLFGKTKKNNGDDHS